MQYTDHYNLNLPEGTDIVNPLIQDNPNYSAIDTALYANKLRVIGTATELKTGTVHALTRSDQDIPVFRFVATSDFNAGDAFTVDGVTVTCLLADGTTLKEGAYVINATVIGVLDGTRLTLINCDGLTDGNNVVLNNGNTLETELAIMKDNDLDATVDLINYTSSNKFTVPTDGYITLINQSGAHGYASILGANESQSFSIGYVEGRFGLYVKAGMKVYCGDTPTAFRFNSLI